MRLFLSQVLRETRNREGKTLRDMEAVVPRDRAQLSRIETGDTGRVFEHLEAVVAGYAEIAGVHPRELWRAALQRWELADSGVRGTGHKARR